MIGSFLDDPKYLAPLDDSDGADNFEVLMSKDELKTLTKEISTAIRHPVTIIDANRITRDVDPEKIRTNSDAEYFSLRNSCRLFRHSAGSEECLKCDHEHAQKFMEYLAEYYWNEEEEYKKLKEIYDFNYKERGNLRYFKVWNFDENKYFSRPVCEYDCNMLGYRELMFPLLYRKTGKVLGILFVDQSVVESEKDEKYVRKTKKGYFADKDLSELFKQSEHEPEKIKDWIINADKRFGDFENLFGKSQNTEDGDSKDRTMTFSDMNEYNRFISVVCSYLRKVEKRIVKKYIEKKKNYFRRVGENIVDNYFDKIIKEKALLSNDSNNNVELRAAWNQLIYATESLKALLGIENIFIFGDGPYPVIDENKKKKIYNNPFNGSVTFDFNVLKEFDNDTFYTSFRYPELLEGLESDVDIHNCFIISFSDIALAFCVEKLDGFREIYKGMAGVIGAQFVRIHSYVARITSEFLQEKIKLTLRMNRHETAHISTRLKDDIDWYFSDDGQAFIKLRPEKQAHIVEDIRNTTRLLSNMANNIGVITGSINKENIRNKFGTVDINDMLNKWRVMFADRLKQRNLSLVVGEPEYGLRGLSHIRTVPDLFELMIYNLVDNAVKYAYRGTNIYMYWERCRGGNKFTVVDFGTEIKKDEDIFSLYVRGKTENSKKVEGDGIGLYSVKKICELLRYEVDYSCELVSEYNLPLIEWYEKEFKNSVKHDEKVKSLYQYLCEFDDELKEDIINVYPETIISDYDITKDYLTEKIDHPIYKTVFTVRVFDK